MKKIIAGALLVAAMTGLTACNTVEGVGKDVEAGGEVVQDVAKDVKEEIKD